MYSAFLHLANMPSARSLLWSAQKLLLGTAVVYLLLCACALIPEVQREWVYELQRSRQVDILESYSLASACQI